MRVLASLSLISLLLGQPLVALSSQPCEMLHAQALALPDEATSSTSLHAGHGVEVAGDAHQHNPVDEAKQPSAATARSTASNGHAHSKGVEAGSSHADGEVARAPATSSAAEEGAHCHPGAAPGPRHADSESTTKASIHTATPTQPVDCSCCTDCCCDTPPAPAFTEDPAADSASNVSGGQTLRATATLLASGFYSSSNARGPPKS